MAPKRIKAVLFAGSYKEQYPRNAIMIKGLKRKGIRVYEFNIKTEGTFKSLKILLKQFKNLLSLDYDLILLHAPNIFQIFFCKLLSRIKRVRLVFDIFLSKYLSYYHDRKIYQEKKIPKIIVRIYYYLMDVIECNTGDILLLDTYSQIKYMHEKYNVPLIKFKRLFVGAQDDIFYPLERVKSEKAKFKVGFWGTFIPLHGVEYILHTVNLLRHEKDINFILIGDGITYQSNKRLAKELDLPNIEFIKKNFVVNDELHLLPSYLAEFDVGLGIFGSTFKSKIVIPNKLFEGIAMRLPMISAESVAIKELFTHNENIIMCDRNNPQTLADAILTLKRDKDLREKIAWSGYQLFLKYCSIEKIGNSLIRILEKYLNRTN